jgi:hypothetical protein
MRPHFIGKFVVVGMLSAALAGGVQAASEPRDDAPVVAVEDKTVESQCWESINNGPRHPCSSASIIISTETVYAEVKKAGIKDYVVVTSDKKKDKEEVDKLVLKIYKEKAGDVFRTMGCVAHQNKYVFRGYKYPNNGVQNYFNMRYSARSNCETYDIADTAYTEGANGQWYRTCTDWEQPDPYNKRCNYPELPLTSKSWAPWRAEQNSWLGHVYYQELWESWWRADVTYRFD